MIQPLNHVEVAELGRDRVIAELQQAGLAVSRPTQHQPGAHLIAYAELATTPPTTVPRPLRVQAASQSSFRVLRWWNNLERVILVYTWHVAAPDQSVSFALTYAEAAQIVERMGWHHSASWRVHGGYGTTNAEPNRRLRDLLEPYRMTPRAWRDKIASTLP
ncbi:MAG: hypothetical protein AB7K36_31070 [Chloroflexota bacterium]